MKTYGFARTGEMRRGMALLLVLAAVALVSLLTLAFLLSTNHELVSSKSYASGSSARLFADSAVNLVIGQLQAGTTQDNIARTWVSQPGLIRLYDTTGTMVNAYKLYSSNKMVDSGTFSPLDSSGNPADVPAWTSSTPASSLPWVQYPNVYVDLNSPITVNSTTKYPIVDPGGLNASTQIEGFSVGSQVSGNTALANQIPMPVTWLYVLTDGRLATPATNPTDPASVTLSTLDGQLVAANNPPVARVAFWTDDNTCRLNINTASEGCYWQIPFDDVDGDAKLGYAQPYTYEYQRYPGHPAQTCLSPIFDYLISSPTSTTTALSDLRNFIYSLTPRVSGRGSQFGTRYIGYGTPVVPDSDRLYSSVDELLFLPQVNTATSCRYSTTSANMQAIDNALPAGSQHLDGVFTSSTSTKNTPYTFGNSLSLDAQRLEYARFFLTTDSRAPEINLFGQPRISLWPVDTRAAYQSTWDKELAFCASTGTFGYYFQRQDSTSATTDAGIQRNVDLLAYLNHLTSTSIPGYNGRFSTKYPAADLAQVKTSIFDWIRTVNLAYPDMSGTVQAYAWTPNSGAPSPSLLYPPGQPGSGQVVPIQIGSTQGYGRFPTLSKAAVAIMRESEAKDFTSATYRVALVMETYVPMMGYAGYIPNYHIKVSGLANAFNFVYKLPSTGSLTTQAITMQDGDIHVTAPCNFEAYSGRAWGGTQGFNHLFLYSDPSNQYALTARTVGSSDADKGYPFVSGQITVPCAATDIDKIQVGLTAPTSPTSITVSFLDASDSTTIATYTLPFISFAPVTGAFLSSYNSTVTTSTATLGTFDTAPDLQSRVNQLVMLTAVPTNDSNDSSIYYKAVVGRADVVRGLELNHGDLRISAITGTDSNSQFVSSKNYTGTYTQAQALLGSGGNATGFDNAWTVATSTTTTTNTLTGAVTPVVLFTGSATLPRGVLVAGTSGDFNASGGKAVGTPATYFPQAPSSMTGLPPSGYSTSPGDFSNGLGCEGDGPHIMKADEGNSSYTGENWGQSAPYPYQNQYFPFDSKLAAVFSPNRQVASAVQLGSLPSQPKSFVPWQTLMFHPDYNGTLFGTKVPADSLLLDLFWMPVVDPYPMSEEYSTAGKVNMNYQIVPFTYITRATAMIGALRSVTVGAIMASGSITEASNTGSMSGNYKHAAWTKAKDGNNNDVSNEYAVDPVQTLVYFNDRFSQASPSSNIFKSATEICSIPLIPMSNANTLIQTGYSTTSNPNAINIGNFQTLSTPAQLNSLMKTFWSDNALTGDNTVEAPYNALYPRLTTQSNTYTVYVRAQALQVTGSPGNGVFTMIADRVTGEYRGSYEVERYLNLNDTTIPDFANSQNYSKTIYPYYKFRVLSNKQFLP